MVFFTALNASAALVAGIVFLGIGWKLLKTMLPGATDTVSNAHAVLWLLVGAALATIGLREYAALFGFSQVDVILFFAAGFFIVSIAAPTTFKAVYMATQNTRHAGLAGSIVFLLALMSPIVAVATGIEKTVSTAYGTEHVLASALPLTLYFVFTGIPVVVFCLMLIGMGLHTERDALRKRLLLMPIGVLLFFLLTALDVVPLIGVAQLILRLLFFVNALLVYVTYFSLRQADVFEA